jgi:hypothetical protein
VNVSTGIEAVAQAGGIGEYLLLQASEWWTRPYDARTSISAPVIALASPSVVVSKP